jgi:hypothetical protein
MKILLDGDARKHTHDFEISQNRVHTTFQFIFAANPLKTSSPPFSWSRIPGRQAHNVAMTISGHRNLSLANPFACVFIRGQIAFERNRQCSFPYELNLTSENYGAQLQLEPSGILSLPYPRSSAFISGQNAFSKKVIMHERTQQVTENTPPHPGRNPGIHFAVRTQAVASTRLPYSGTLTR